MIETCEDILPGDVVRFHGFSLIIPVGSIGTVLEKDASLGSMGSYYLVHWWAIDERRWVKRISIIVRERADDRSANPAQNLT
jgi:hypothetical protein